MVQLHEHEHVIRQPAHEERGHQGAHDSEGFGGLGHPAVPKSEDDDRVADDDDDERDDEARDEADQCHQLVAVLAQAVVVEAGGLAHVWAHLPKDHRGQAQPDSQEPGQSHADGRHLDRAVVLGPDREGDGHEAVDADDDQEEDAAEHVEEHHGGDEFAHEAAKDPLLHDGVGDGEREEGAEDEVGDGEAQVPGGVDRLLHLQAGDPDDQSVPTEAQQENNHVDHDERYTQGLF